MKKKLLYSAAVTSCAFLFTMNTNALTTYKVNNVTEYFDAIESIHNATNEEFVIKLDNDIVVTSASDIKNNNTIDNGNTVTVLGQGHTYKCTVSNNCRFSVSGGHLILGAEDKSDTLVLEGAGTAADAGEGLVNVYSNGVAEMYDGVTLTNNKSSSLHLVGCGIRVGDNGTFKMHGGIITGNSTNEPGMGGAVMVDGTNSLFVMEDGEISNNSAKTGGAINQKLGKMQLLGGVIKNNSASIQGGGLTINGGESVIKNTTIENNTSATYGAGIFIYTDAYTSEPIKTEIDGNIIKDNSGKFGSGITVWDTTGVVIKNNTIESNTSTSYGGGLFVIKYSIDASVISNNNKIINNKTNSYGGGVFLYNGTITSTNDVIKDNTARSGGGVFLNAGTGSFATTDIYNNKASAAANDVYISSNVVATIKDPSEMNGYATYGNNNVNLKNWYVDEEENPNNNVYRYSLDNPTEIVTTINSGRGYALTASGAKANIVTFNFGDNNTVEQAVEVGQKVTKPTAPTKYGKKLVNWYTNEALTEVFDFDTEVSGNVTLYAKWEDIVYEVIKGAGQAYTKNVDENASFTIDADYSNFGDNSKVYINKVEISRDKYSSKSGSTIITLNSEYLNTLADGTYNLDVLFDDGGTASTTFTIGVKDSSSDSDSSQNTDSDSTIVNPSTGDNIMLYAVVFSMSIITFLISFVCFRKRKSN